MIQHPFCFHKERGKEGRSFVQLCYTRSHHYALATSNGLQYPRLDASLSPVIKIKCPEILYITSFVPKIPIVFCVIYFPNKCENVQNGFTKNSILLPCIDPWLFSLLHQDIGFHHSTQ